MTFGNQSPWMVDGEGAKAVLRRAWDLGITFYDTADVYSKGRSEEILGEFLKGGREDAVVATKVYNPMGEGPNRQGLSSKHLHDAARRVAPQARDGLRGPVPDAPLGL